MSQIFTYNYSFTNGNHRSPTTWQLTNFTGSYRGYTGHERRSPRRRQMLPQYALINMNVSFKRGQNEANFNFVERRNFGEANGRMYDPVISRVLSPDNFVQDTLNAQNFNRYSYCLNNPLKYSDPSGWLISPYFDIKGNFLGVDENGFSGQIFITSKETFNTFSKDGIGDSKMLQKSGDTKEFYSYRSKLTDNAINSILTKIIDGTELPYGEGKLKEGEFNVKFTNDYSSNGEYKGLQNSVHHFDFSVTNYEWTVENISGTAIHEIWEHGIKGYANRVEDKHHLIYGAQIDDSQNWKQSTNEYKGFVLRHYEKYYKEETGLQFPNKYLNIIKKYKH